MDRIKTLMSKLEHEVRQEILFHLGDVGTFTPSDLHRVEQLQRMGVNMDSINRKIAKARGGGIQIIEQHYQEQAKKYYGEITIGKNGTHFIPFAENIPLQNYIQVLLNRTKDSFTNITGSLGFLTKDKVPLPLAQYYQETLDYALFQVESGVYDYNKAIRQGARALSDGGMQWVEYGSGHRNRAVTAVDRALFTGGAQIREETNRLLGREFGADGMEVSFHQGYRPTHDFGGKQFSMAEYTANILPRLHDYNCRHYAFPIVLGISEPSYSSKQLRQMVAKEQKKLPYEGKRYNKYEQTQKQREIERAIRFQKERVSTFTAVGDVDAAGIAKMKLTVLNKEYRKFSGAMGFPLQRERTWVYGYHQ